MIRLYQFPPALGLPNASPFCLKLETWLRMAGVPYENVYTLNLRRAPKGKLPWIADGEVQVADSGLVIDYLRRARGDPLDAALTPAQRALALAVQRLLEEHLYWALTYVRWIEAAGWEATREGFFGHLAPPLKWIVPVVARRGVQAQLQGHGMGRHGAEEIAALGCADLTALADLLGDQPFFLGEAPTSLDACAYGFLANILLVDLDTALRRHARSLPQLGAFCERMRTRYWAG